MAIATSLSFTQWRTVLPDRPPIAAIVGCITIDAHLVETGAESFRLPVIHTSASKKLFAQDVGMTAVVRQFA